ncbi:MAG: HAD family hydrolase [Pirellulales bacterium]
MNLLVSDLDGTLLGDDRALDGFAVWHEQIKDRLRLVYSSGRFLDSIRESIDVFRLPEPDAIICGVGTEIHEMATGKRLLGWPRMTYNWNPHVVRTTCAAHRELQEQPQQLLSHYKVSFFGYDLDEAFLGQLACQLTDNGQEVSIVYSSNRDLDILPAETNKGAAAAFLARRWRIADEQVIVAGDSGNDLEMFRAGFRGIVVGNAQPELLRLSDPNVYHAAAPYAAGVLEGLQHWLDDFWQVEATSDQSSRDRDVNHGRHE